MPISKWVDQKTMVHLHNGILQSRKKEGAPTFPDNTDGTGKHYAKWNKPGSEREIQYDLTYMCNLIKTNKQVKYNQKYWNKEQTDSYQRGGGRGIIGKGPSRNMYKGHMEKAKRHKFEGGRQGWVGWGCVRGVKNGDNCTWTTIKKCLEKKKNYKEYYRNFWICVPM